MMARGTGCGAGGTTILVVSCLLASASPLVASDGLPSEFELGGFRLSVTRHDLDSDAARDMSGEATTTWGGDASNVAIPLRFTKVVLADPNRSRTPVAERGSASFVGDGPLRFAPAGRSLDLASLSLTPDGARARFRYRLPPSVFRESRWVTTDPVTIEGGEEFAAEMAWPSDVAVVESDPERPVLRLAGATLVLDFSTTRGTASGPPEPSWTGVALAGGEIRVGVRPPDAARPETGLFLPERLDTSFLYGRFGFLEIGTDGMLHGERIRAVPVTAVRPMTGERADPVLAPILPVGFGIEVQGGHFSLQASRVSDVDLAGRLHLPPEYDAAPLPFDHLRRAEDPSSDFETGEIDRGLPTVYLGRYSYRPRAGRFRMPSTIGVGAGQTFFLAPPKRIPPGDASELATWEASVRDGLRGHGLLLWGGIVAAPWTVAEPPASRGPPTPPPAPVDPWKRMFPAPEGIPTGPARPAIEPIVTVPGAPSRSEPERMGEGTRLLDALTGSRTDVEDFLVDSEHRVRRSRTSGSRGRRIDLLLEAPSLLDLPGLDLVEYPFRHARQGGAFLLESAGTRGEWFVLEDPELRKVGRFTAEIDRTGLVFRQSALVDSVVVGRLVIPYPSQLEIGFHGTLTPQGDILVPEDGLAPPAAEDGWYLRHWRMSLFPRPRPAPATRAARPPLWPADVERDERMDDVVGEPSLRPSTGTERRPATGAVGDPSAAGSLLESLTGTNRIIDVPPGRVELVETGAAPGPAVVFHPDRIVVPFAGLRLDVAEAFGGGEFDRADGGHPFTVALEIGPDGQIDDVAVRPASGGLRFLGIPFQPSSRSIEVRRYIGRHAAPAEDEALHPGWLVRVEGDLQFQLFGKREVRIHHTAMGARVPYVEPLAEGGDGRVIADEAGVLTLDARLRFVNTFGAPDWTIKSRFPPTSIAPGAESVIAVPGRDSELDLPEFKAFVGDAELRILNAVSFGGLAEAGVWSKSGDPRRYEKVGIGGGVDVVKGIMAALHGMETAAKLGGAVVEITTGAEGLGAEVIHVSVDAASFASSVATTIAVGAATVGTGGGASPALEEELRHLAGNGLELSASTVDLLKKIYEQRPFEEFKHPDATTHPPYVGLEVTDILLTAAGMAVEFEKLSPEEAAEVVLQSLDVAIPVMQRMQIGDPNVPADVAADARTDIALILAHILVKAARPLAEGRDRIPEETAWELAAKAVEASRLFLELPEVRENPELRALPLAVAVAGVAVTVGRNLSLGGDDSELEALVALVDELLTLTCEEPELVEPMLAAAGLDPDDAYNVVAASQHVFASLDDAALLGGAGAGPPLDPAVAVSDVVLPVLDGFIDGGGPGACAGRLRYDPYDAEIRSLLRVAREALSIVHVARAGESESGVAAFRWATGTVRETAVAVNTLRPGSMDDRLVGVVENLDDAADAIDPSKSREVQLLSFASALMPTVRATAVEIAPEDPVAPEIVDVVGAGIAAAIPVMDGGQTDVAAWLDGTVGILREVQDLPLRKDARAAFGVAGRALELTRDGVRGHVGPAGLVRGSREIVDLLRGHVEAGTFDSVLIASNAPASELAALVPDSSELASILAVAGAVLAALEDALERGELSLAAVGDLVAAIAQAFAPGGAAPRGVQPAQAGGGGDWAPVDAALRALSILDPTRGAEEAATEALLRLVAAEESSAGDPEIRQALRRARAALLLPPIGVVNARRNPHLREWLSDESSRREVDEAGASRQLLVLEDPEDRGHVSVFLQVEYPEGHPLHPGGLSETWLLDPVQAGAFFTGTRELVLASYSLEEIEAALVEVEGKAPEWREYRDADRNRVRYERTTTTAEDGSERDVQLVWIRDAVTYGPLRPMRMLEVEGAPDRGAPAGGIAGPILKAWWHDETGARNAVYDSRTSRVVIRSLTFHGAWEMRSVPTPEGSYESVGDVPLDGALLAYHGPATTLPASWVVDYRQGDNEVTVHDGRSYDRLRVDPSIEIVSPSQIPLDGDLLERRRFLAAGTSWLYRPGVHAIFTEPCGRYTLHSLGPSTELIDVPDPTGEIETGEPLANGDALGGIARGTSTDEPLVASAMAFLGVDQDETGISIQWPDGRAVLYAGGGSTWIRPGTPFETRDDACEDQDVRVGGFHDGAGRHLTSRDGQETTTASEWRVEQVRQIERRAGGQCTVRRSHVGEGWETVVIDADDPVADRPRCVPDPPAPIAWEEACAPGAFRQLYERAPMDVAAVTSGSAASRPLVAPGVGDPLRGEKILFLNDFVEALQELEASPSVDRILRLESLLERGARESVVVQGLRPRASQALAVALSGLIDAEVEAILAGRHDPARLAAWLAGEPEEDDLDRLLLRVGLVRVHGLTLSARIATSFVRTFPQNGVQQHPVADLIRAIAADLERDCADRDASLRARGAWLLARFIQQADRCGEAEASALGATLQATMDLLAERQNACLDAAVNTDPPDPVRLGKAQRDTLDRMADAAMLDLDPAWPVQALKRSAERRIRHAARAIRDELERADRTPDSVKRTIKDFVDAVGEGQLLHEDVDHDWTPTHEAVDDILATHRRELGDALDACGPEQLVDRGCNATTLAGCDLDRLPGCDFERVRVGVRDLMDARSVGQLLRREERLDRGEADAAEVAEDNALFTRMVRTAVALAAGRAERARRVPDGRSVAAAFREASVDLQTGDAAGIDTLPARQLLDARRDAVLDSLRADILAAEQRGDQGGADELTRASLVLLASGAQGSAADALRPEVLSRLDALERHDRDRLDVVLHRGVHLFWQVERALLNLLDVATLGEVLRGGSVVDARNAARSYVAGIFRDYLAEEPSVRFALPFPDPDPTRDRLAAPTPSEYDRGLVRAWLERDDSENASRFRAAGHLLDVVTRYNPDIPSHRSALVDLAAFVQQEIELDARRRERQGAPAPPAAGDDPLSGVLRTIAATVGDEVLARRLGTGAARSARRRADEAAAHRDRLEQERQEAAASGEDTEVLAMLDAEVERATTLAQMAEELAAGLATPAEPIDEADRLAHEMERLASQEPWAISLADAGGSIVGPITLLGRFGADPFKAFAAELEPVVALGGADLRLAHRLADRLPSPAAEDDASYRFGAIGELAGYLVDELFLDRPDGAEPAANVASRGEADLLDPETLLVAALRMTQPRPGVSPGGQLAEAAGELLRQAGSSTEDPLVGAGLLVGAAAVDGAAVALLAGLEGRDADAWIDVVEAASQSLSSNFSEGDPPERFWPALAGRIALLGVDVHRGRATADIAGRGLLEASVAILEYPDVAATVRELPEPGPALVGIAEQLVNASLGNLGAGDPVEVALARALGHGLYPADTLGRDLTDWTLDYAAGVLPAVSSSVASPGDVEPTAFTGPLIQADGVPRLACTVTRHVPEVDLPPTLALVPMVAIHELVGSPQAYATEENERRKALLDVGAGLVNVWVATEGLSDCADPQGVSGEDAPFATSVRRLKDLESMDRAGAFRFMGEFGLGAADTFAPGSTLARVLHVLWWGREEPPQPGEAYIGLGSALSDDVSVPVELAFKTPVIAGDIVRILAEDPALDKTMRLLSGECRDSDLLPPDRCWFTGANPEIRRKGTIPNLMLATLGDVRRGIKNLPDAAHANDPRYGWMRTLPVMGPGNHGLPDLSRVSDVDAWNETVAAVTDLETVSENATRAGLAVVDFSRMSVNTLASLQKLRDDGPTAADIQQRSVFLPQVGGETFSGLAGGLMREWSPTGDPVGDLYFELAAQLVIPALLNTAVQLTFQTVADDWRLQVLAGANTPDLDAVLEDIGISVPANHLASLATGELTGSLGGWIGQADDALYAQLFAEVDYSRGAVDLAAIDATGFVHGIGASQDLLANAEGLSFGLCAQQSTQLNPAMYFTGEPTIGAALQVMTLGMGTTFTLGGYFFKQELKAGYGFKVGTTADFTIPAFPIAGISLGVDLGSAVGGGMDTGDGLSLSEAALTGDVDDLGAGFEVGLCVRPFLRGNFLGMELEDLDTQVDVQVFGNAQVEGAEAGVKLKFEVGEALEDQIREALSCPGTPILCDMLGQDGLLAWMALSNEGFYFGLGTEFPSAGDDVLKADLNPDGTFGIPLPARAPSSWGGWSSTAMFNSPCAREMCGTFSDPPPGAVVADPPPREGS